MAINIPRLRTWFAVMAVAVVMVVAGFYFYARMQVRRAVKDIPKKLGVEIQQSTEGFSLSKSEGGRTLFTIRASKAVQYKEGEKGGRAELRDVNIVVYGRKSNRFDQIYGEVFQYDPKSGDITAKGKVHIDLEANAEGAVHPDQSPPQDLKNPIHLETSGLVFNQKTGIANTEQEVEFRIPQASGSCTGATYDAHANLFTMKSAVHIVANGPKPTTLDAAHGVITKEPRRIALEGVKVEQANRDIEAQHLTAYLTDDNNLDHLLATGDVRMNDHGPNALAVRSPRADVQMGGKNFLRSAVFFGGVQFQGITDNAVNGTASRVLLDFAAQNHLDKIRASGDVHIQQQPAKGRTGQAVEIVTNAIDLRLVNGKLIQTADTDGAAQITLNSVSSQKAGEKTVITAGKFHAAFDHNRLSSLRGEPNARIVSSAPGQPDKVSTSRTFDVKFGSTGQIAEILQQGDFQYREPAPANAKGPSAGRSAFASAALYSPADETLSLSGSPRIIEGGMTISAQKLRINRRTGDAFAEGEVKTTYSELKQEPNGALLATADPVHVTAKSVTAQRQSGVARYSGGARLWQGPNIVQAPTIEFDRTHRGIVAQGTGAQPVSSVFVQTDKAGKTTPVVVTAARLEYVDADRRAHYTGGVTAKGADVTITADHIDVILQASGKPSTGAPTGPSQLNQIVAEGHVVIQQTDRRATGEKLVYTAADSKFVLTGGPPTISDAERGSIRGDSLTFYTRDDRVLVESKDSSRTVTHTRVSR